jgi:cytoskeletal protein CcmA (bactofilin family)
MEGNLVTGHQAAFKSKARFEGALQCSRIFIEDGAHFNGTCKMISEEEYSQMVEKYNSSAKNLR